MLATGDRNQEFRIVLSKTAKSDSFGFSVFGGLGSALPVVVSEIKENSIADQCGQLEVGDILVEANGLRLLENVLSTLEVSRYLQAQPTLTLELKIRKDPVIRRKTHDILKDPEDFEKISSAVSPDNLQALRRLTIQSTHTHQLERREEFSPNRSFQSACNLHVRTISHGSNLSDESSTGSVKEEERKQRLDWSTNNCYPGYATIRITPTKNKEETDSIAKSMPTNVDLIGQPKTIKISQSPEKEAFNDSLLTGGSLPRSPRSPASYKASPKLENDAKSAKQKFLAQEVSLPRRLQKEGVNFLDTNGFGVNDGKGAGQFSKDQTHKRSLSPEIKEAIASADPSSCWADYFPESISLISSSNQNSTRTTTTVVQTTTTHSSLVQKYSILTPNNSSNSTNENSRYTVPSLMNDNPPSPQSNSCPSQNHLSPTTASNSDNQKGSTNVNNPITPPPMTHKKSVTDSLTDEEVSPYQQTQHFNSPVLGASERTLFFNSDTDHFDASVAKGLQFTPPSTSSCSSIIDEDSPTNGPQTSPLLSTEPSLVSSTANQILAPPTTRRNGVRRDSFEKESGEIDDDDDSPVGQCYILKSLEIAGPPPPKPTPEVDLAAAKRLATRLFYLNGFDRSDVPKHLGKKQDFSQAVATEYFKFYDFTGERIDVSLRKFFLNLFLCGDTQERERILSHFSRRYFDCNPTLFPSFESVDYLVTAIVLLNQDLNTIQAGSRSSMGVRPMTAQQFVTNVITKPQPLHILHCNPNQPPEEYSEYSRELLTELYYSIRDEPLLCAVCPLPPNMTAGIPTDPNMMNYSQEQGLADNALNQFHPKFASSLDPAILSQQAQFNLANFSSRLPTCSGYLNRKWLFEPDLKKTGKLKRSWKHWYVKLQGLDLIHHKSREDAQKSTGGEQKAVILSLHHCLALPVNPDDYKDLSQTEISEDEDAGLVSNGSEGGKSEKKRSRSSSKSSLQSSKWDFTLRTADWAEYQFRCRGKQEMNEWIAAINLVAAHSSPPLMAPIANNPSESASQETGGKSGSKSNGTSAANGSAGMSNSFQKHFKPAAFTNLKIQDQIAVWGDWVNKSEIEHAEAMRRHANLPSNTSKSVVQSIEQEIVYFEFEVQRYQCYQEALIENLNNARSLISAGALASSPVDMYGHSLHMNHPAGLLQKPSIGASQPFSIDECSSDMTPNTACVQYPNMNQSDPISPQPTPEFMNVTPDIPGQIPRLFPKKPSPGLSHNAVDYGVL